jgi:hypothetical protein
MNLTEIEMEQVIAERIALWLEWRAGNSLYSPDGQKFLPSHSRATASGWSEAGLATAATKLRLVGVIDE